ncbi:hypothetical protein GW17_00040803 [Ensete ventricosum]|nr:hypothetical protein GW17_00040803 [Ensete ventricosum]RZS14710.1 hypothetical protein BHM03_00046432 [Ensete ventricosum]
MLPFFRTNPSSRTPKRFTQWLEHVRELWLRSPLSQQPPSDLDLQILRALQPKNREDKQHVVTTKFVPSLRERTFIVAAFSIGAQVRSLRYVL